MNHAGLRIQSLRSEEDCCTEDSFESGHKPPVLLPALGHPKCVQHLRCGSESNDLAFLLDCPGSEHDRHQPVLTERQAKVWMAGQLKDEMSVPPLVQELSGRRAPNGQAAQHERSRRKGQSLRTRLSIISHQRDSVRLPHPVFRNNEIRMRSCEYRSGALQPRRTSFAATSRGGTHLSPHAKTG